MAGGFAEYLDNASSLESIFLHFSSRSNPDKKSIIEFSLNSWLTGSTTSAGCNTLLYDFESCKYFP